MAFGVIIASHKCHCNIVWPHIETVDLKGTEVLKASSFVLHSSLLLNCGGEVYTFKGALPRPRRSSPVSRKAATHN